MSRRKGQDPKVRIGKRADGSKYFYFQYYVDVAGQEERQRKTEVVGVVGQMTWSEAQRQRNDFLLKLGVNSADYRIPSSQTFAAAVKHYREEYAPNMLRESTLSVANTHLRAHLEPDWGNVPIAHINTKKVNEWGWKKRQQGLSWVTIKNILRTMQRVLTCYLDTKKHPPFSLDDLAIPEKDKVAMSIQSDEAARFSWDDTRKIVRELRKLEHLDDARKDRYATLFTVASASGLRCGELFALRMDDLNFQANTIRVNESRDRLGTIGPCKNAKAYRTVLLADREGKQAMSALKTYVRKRFQNPSALVFASRRETPLSESQMLREGLHPALKAAGLAKDGMHAFRRGCNRRWELAGMNPAVLRQQMGHTSSAMTARYTGQLPLAYVQADFSRRNGPKIVVLENKENAPAA